MQAISSGCAEAHAVLGLMLCVFVMMLISDVVTVPLQHRCLVCGMSRC
jgi:hypothetical protein